MFTNWKDDELMTKEEADAKYERGGYGDKPISAILFPSIVKTLASMEKACKEIEKGDYFEAILKNNRRYLYNLIKLLSRCATQLSFMRDCSKHPRYKNNIDEMLKCMNEINEPFDLSLINLSLIKGKIQ